jgi:dehydrogenase/reductase SDR family member 7B
MRIRITIDQILTDMKNHFKNSVVWITGASSGIGEALARAFSTQGAKLILSSRRYEELERVRKSCDNPDNIQILPLDLSDIPSLDGKVADALACFGTMDIMVHNGGISQRSLVVDTDLSVHRRVMELDYFSYVAITKALLPHFIERKSGHFVVTSSIMGKIGTPMRSAYAAAKHALHGFFDCLRAEVAQDNIQVTILTPGYIRTHISLHALTKAGDKLGILSENIANGLAPELAAAQILRVIAKGSFESYIGKFSVEKIVLWLNRLSPNLVIKRASKFGPK